MEAVKISVFSNWVKVYFGEFIYNEFALSGNYRSLKMTLKRKLSIKEIRVLNNKFKNPETIKLFPMGEFQGYQDLMGFLKSANVGTHFFEELEESTELLIEEWEHFFNDIHKNVDNFMYAQKGEIDNWIERQKTLGNSMMRFELVRNDISNFLTKKQAQFEEKPMTEKDKYLTVPGIDLYYKSISGNASV